MPAPTGMMADPGGAVYEFHSSYHLGGVLHHRLSHRLHRVHRADDAVSEPRGALPPFVLMRRSTSACPTSTTL